MLGRILRFFFTGEMIMTRNSTLQTSMGACIGAKLIFQCRDGHRHCGAAFIPLGRLPVLKGGIHFNGAPVGVDGRHVSPGAPIGDWGGINFTEAPIGVDGWYLFIRGAYRWYRPAFASLRCLSVF